MKIDSDRPVAPTELQPSRLCRKLFNSPEVNALTTGWNFPVSMDQQMSWFAGIKTDQRTQRFIFENEAGEAIGTIFLSNIDYRNRVAEIGGDKILPAFWGRHYGAYATLALLQIVFEFMDFYLIEVKFVKENERSLKQLTHLGFSCDGVLRSRAYKNGRRYDMVVVSMTAEEYWAAKEKSFNLPRT